MYKREGGSSYFSKYSYLLKFAASEVSGFNVLALSGISYEFFLFHILTGVFVFISATSSASNAQESKIRELEERIKSLERQSQDKNGLKTKDLKGNTSDTNDSQVTKNKPAQPEISLEEKERIMQELKKYKRHREEGNKLLDQLESEGL